MRKKLVYICSPCRGDIEKNIIKAQGYCREAVEFFPDVIPIAPHVYFTQFLDELNPDERALGMDMGITLLDICDELWVYGIENPSEGMSREIEYAREHEIPIRDAAEVYQQGQQEEKPLGELLLRFPEENEDGDETGHTVIHLPYDLLEFVTKRLRQNRGSDFMIDGWSDEPKELDEVKA